MADVVIPAPDGALNAYLAASYGAKDVTLRGAAGRLERALTALGVDHDVKEYPDAGHAFLNKNSALATSTGMAISTCS
ncbi:MAG: dienelactone hydrolase family protein, partial [Roseiflexaceae bacterium]|nr:dienelactone hydrolase family protein [Roseiflexaceae bacterium]